MSSSTIVKNTLSEWSTREQLILASAVQRSGDQNWVSVSRAIRPLVTLDAHPSDYYSQKNCAQQYSAMLDKAGTHKRKRSTEGGNDVVETAGQQIVRELTEKYLGEINMNLAKKREEYLALKKEIEQLERGELDSQLPAMWEEVQAEMAAKEAAITKQSKGLTSSSSSSSSLSSSAGAAVAASAGSSSSNLSKHSEQAKQRRKKSPADKELLQQEVPPSSLARGAATDGGVEQSTQKLIKVEGSSSKEPVPDLLAASSGGNGHSPRLAVKKEPSAATAVITAPMVLRPETSVPSPVIIPTLPLAVTPATPAAAAVAKEEKFGLPMQTPHPSTHESLAEEVHVIIQQPNIAALITEEGKKKHTESSVSITIPSLAPMSPSSVQGAGGSAPSSAGRSQQASSLTTVSTMKQQPIVFTKEVIPPKSAGMSSFPLSSPLGQPFPPGPLSQPCPPGPPSQPGPPGPPSQPCPLGPPSQGPRGPPGQPSQGPRGPPGQPSQPGPPSQPYPPGLPSQPYPPDPPNQPYPPGPPGQPGPPSQPGPPGPPGPPSQPYPPGPPSQPCPPGPPSQPCPPGPPGQPGPPGPPSQPGLSGLPIQPGPPSQPGAPPKPNSIPPALNISTGPPPPPPPLPLPPKYQVPEKIAVVMPPVQDTVSSVIPPLLATPTTKASIPSSIMVPSVQSSLATSIATPTLTTPITRPPTAPMKSQLLPSVSPITLAPIVATKPSTAPPGITPTVAMKSPTMSPVISPTALAMKSRPVISPTTFAPTVAMKPAMPPTSLAPTVAMKPAMPPTSLAPTVAMKPAMPPTTFAPSVAAKPAAMKPAISPTTLAPIMAMKSPPTVAMKSPSTPAMSPTSNVAMKPSVSPTAPAPTVALKSPTIPAVRLPISFTKAPATPPTVQSPTAPSVMSPITPTIKSPFEDSTKEPVKMEVMTESKPTGTHSAMIVPSNKPVTSSQATPTDTRILRTSGSLTRPEATAVTEPALMTSQTSIPTTQPLKVSTPLSPGPETKITAGDSAPGTAETTPITSQPIRSHIKSATTLPSIQPPGATTAAQQTAPSLSAQQKAPSLTAQQKAPSLTAQQKAPSLTAQQKAPSLTAQQKAPSLTAQPAAARPVQGVSAGPFQSPPPSSQPSSTQPSPEGSLPEQPQPLPEQPRPLPEQPQPLPEQPQPLPEQLPKQPPETPPPAEPASPSPTPTPTTQPEEEEPMDEEAPVKTSGRHSKSALKKQWNTRSRKRKFPFDEGHSVESTDTEEDLSTQTSAVSSPAPQSSSEIGQENLQAHKQWKKAIIIVWRHAAQHKYANLFLHPVREEDAPGYKNVILRPMDLSTIKKKIELGLIKTDIEFQRDMLLMFQNAFMYNNVEHEVFSMAQEMKNDVMQNIQAYLATQAQLQLMEATTPSKTLRSRLKDTHEDTFSPAKKRRTRADD